MESLAQESPARITKVFGTPGKFQKTREIIPVPEGHDQTLRSHEIFWLHPQHRQESNQTRLLHC